MYEFFLVYFICMLILLLELIWKWDKNVAAIIKTGLIEKEDANLIYLTSILVGSLFWLPIALWQLTTNK